MKRTLLMMIVFFVLPFVLTPEESKTVYIPDKINVEKIDLKVTTLFNLSDIEIYRYFSIYTIDDSIYLLDMKNCRVFRFSLQGKVLAQFGKKGEGPGESLRFNDVSRFNENIAILGKQKVIICTKDLKYLREIKLTEFYQNLILSTDHKIYFYSNPSNFNYYFSVYTEDFKYLKKFGIKDPSIGDKEITDKNAMFSFDNISTASYVPEENGIWVSFQNRYDIRYYKNEKTVVDIKSKSQVFSTKEEEFSGVKLKVYVDHPVFIEKYKNRLYYGFQKEGAIFCDVFDLSGNYRLLRRIQFPSGYKALAFFNESVFFGLRYEGEEENVLLDKIQINFKGGK